MSLGPCRKQHLAHLHPEGIIGLLGSLMLHAQLFKHARRIKTCGPLLVRHRVQL